MPIRGGSTKPALRKRSPIRKSTMPLVKGRSHAAVSKNIKTLLEEGKPHAQAVAISMNVSGKSDKKKKDKSK